MICPSCHHARHAGRCFFVGQVEGKLIPCHCKHKREIPDDVHADRRVGDDDPAGATLPVRPAAGADAELVGTEPRRELARLGAVVADDAEDVLAGIRGIGQTMTDAAARMRGEGT